MPVRRSGVIIVAVAAMLDPVAFSQTQPRPHVSTIANSASYRETDEIGIAQGSLAVLFGNAIGPQQLAQSSGFPLPLTLGGVSVTVTVRGASQDVPIAYVSSQQAAILLPSTTPLGDGTLTLRYQGRATAATPIKVVESAFGVYSLTSDGAGGGVITTSDYKVKTLAAAARPGETLILWGTGLGPMPGAEAAGPLPGNRFPSTEVWVGSQRARVSYAGRSGCCAGLDQIVFEVPDGVQGCSVPVAVRAGSVTSNFVTLPVSAAGGPCAAVVGLTGDELRSAQAGRPIRVAAIGLGPLPVLQGSGLYSAEPIALRVSQALGRRVTAGQVRELINPSAEERRKAALQLLAAGAPGRAAMLANLRRLRQVAKEFEQQASGAAFGQLASLTPVVNRFGEALPPPGACSVYPREAVYREYFYSLREPLDAGAELILNGPLGTRSLRRIDIGQYQTSLGAGFTTLQLPAGRYSVTSTGGANVGAFTASIQVAAPPQMDEQAGRRRRHSFHAS